MLVPVPAPNRVPGSGFTVTAEVLLGRGLMLSSTRGGGVGEGQGQGEGEGGRQVHEFPLFNEAEEQCFQTEKKRVQDMLLESASGGGSNDGSTWCGVQAVLMHRLSMEVAPVLSTEQGGVGGQSSTIDPVRSFVGSSKDQWHGMVAAFTLLQEGVSVREGVGSGEGGKGSDCDEGNGAHAHAHRVKDGSSVSNTVGKYEDDNNNDDGSKVKEQKKEKKEKKEKQSSANPATEMLPVMKFLKHSLGRRFEMQADCPYPPLSKEQEASGRDISQFLTHLSSTYKGV